MSLPTYPLQSLNTIEAHIERLETANVEMYRCDGMHLHYVECGWHNPTAPGMLSHMREDITIVTGTLRKLETALKEIRDAEADAPAHVLQSIAKHAVGDK